MYAIGDAGNWDVHVTGGAHNWWCVSGDAHNQGVDEWWYMLMEWHTLMGLTSKIASDENKFAKGFLR